MLKGGEGGGGGVLCSNLLKKLVNYPLFADESENLLKKHHYMIKNSIETTNFFAKKEVGGHDKRIRLPIKFMTKLAPCMPIGSQNSRKGATLKSFPTT